MTKTTILCADCKEETPLHNARFTPHKEARTKQVCSECWDRLIQENEELESRNKALASRCTKLENRLKRRVGL